MRQLRVRFTVRRMMHTILLLALVFGAERMWRRRQAFLELAAPHAQNEAFLTDLALDLAADPAATGFSTVTALLPDGSAVRFAGHGPGRRIFCPPDATTPSDEATATRLERMCRDEAEKEASLRRQYERAARYPWLSSQPDPPEPDGSLSVAPDYLVNDSTPTSSSQSKRTVP